MPARAKKAPHHNDPKPHDHFHKVLILPGNPGCSAFYAPFAEALSDELGGATEVVALSFHGHETLLRRERIVPLSLDAQIEHASAFLEKLLSEVEVEVEEEEEEESDKNSNSKKTGRRKSRRRPTVAVVGHSIGGTVAALAVREVEERRRRRTTTKEGEEKSAPPAASSSSSSRPLPRAKVAAVCAMMPYVAFDDSSPQQRALRLLAGSPLARVPACLAARALCALVPRAALASLIGVATASSPLTLSARETVADFVRGGGLDHALFLASTEFRALSVPAAATATAEREREKEEGEEEEKREKGRGRGGRSFRSRFSVSSASGIWEPMASLGRRASVFAVGNGGGGDDADGDHWCPGHHLDLLKEQAPLATLELAEGQRHDFVVCDERTAAAARAVAGLLRATASAAAAEEEEKEEEEEKQRAEEKKPRVKVTSWVF